MSSTGLVRDGRCAICLLAALLIQNGCATPSPAPVPAATREGRWRQDLRYLEKNLARLHLNAYHTISRREFRNEVERLDGEIDSLSDDEILVRLARLVARIGDGHTRLVGPSNPPAYPIRLGWFADGLFVTRIASAHQRVVGKQLVQIGSHGIEDAVRAVASITSRDNDEALRNGVPPRLIVGWVLYGLGISPAKDRAVFTIEETGGVRHAIELAATGADDPVDWAQAGNWATDRLPLYRRDVNKPYWFSYLPEQRLLYVAYNSCRERADLSFAEFTKRIDDVLRREIPDKVVVDLRNNGGGNSTVIAPLLKRLGDDRRINQRGQLFVLTSRSTYSSAMMNAIEFRKRTRAVLVGEPTGGKPNSYGELREFKLPNCGLRVTYCTKYFPLLSGEDPPAVIPDLLVETTSSDYFEGRDPVLNAALEWMPENPGDGPVRTPSARPYHPSASTGDRF